MSLKENIDMVKDQLNAEEKFFENAVKAERVWKKYKIAIIGGVVAIVAVVVINAIYEAKNESDAVDSNKVYATLLKGPDATAEKELESLNPKLLLAWKFSNAIASSDVEALETLTSSADAIISDLAKYEIAVIGSDESKISSYATSQNAIYRDLAIIQSALLLMKNDQIQRAHQKLSLISQDSPLFKISKSLMHYGVK